MRSLYWGFIWAAAAWAQSAESVTIRFRAVVDAAGREVPVQLDQDDKWQLDDVGLLDFEDASGSCGNGTPDRNDAIKGTAPRGDYRGLRFTLGVPFEKNHTDLTQMPSPLNLTAMAWVWNAGRKFARLDFSSTGAPRGYALHLGSTDCTPNETKTTVPTNCSTPNRAEIHLAGFQPAHDTVVVDLAALLADSNVDLAGKMMSGCMSGPQTEACAPLFANLGLPLVDQPAGEQKLFRRMAGAAPASSARR
jgi:uncharacterized repeat protein (TIGR04052 family)